MKSIKNQRIKLLISWLISKGYATSQEDLGNKIGINSKSYLSQLVNGKVNNDGFLNKLSQIDDRINLEWLITGDGEMLKPQTLDRLDGLKEPEQDAYEEAILIYKEKMLSGELIPMAIVKEYIQSKNETLQSKNEIIEQLKKEIKRLEERIAELESQPNRR